MKYGKLFGIVLGLCCVAAGVLFILAGKKNGKEVVISPSSDAAPRTQTAADAASGAAYAVKICVHVCGAVMEPGVYALSADARVGDAIEAAGGFSPGADRNWLNLAEPLSDGVQIRVPTLEEGEALAASEAAALSALVNINTAGVEELMTLPGIGEARARAIIAYREANGDFEEITDIMRVSGIKDGAFKKIKDKIRTGG